MEHTFPILFSIQTRLDNQRWIAELHMDVDHTHETIFVGPAMDDEQTAVDDLGGALADHIRAALGHALLH